jgi:hypothetical protein
MATAGITTTAARCAARNTVQVHGARHEHQRVDLRQSLSEGLSPQPWEPREPGWGAHRIEYRAKDAAGNIGAVSHFGDRHAGCGMHDDHFWHAHGLAEADSGVTCLDGGR